MLSCLVCGLGLCSVLLLRCAHSESHFHFLGPCAHPDLSLLYKPINSSNRDLTSDASVPL